MFMQQIGKKRCIQKCSDDAERNFRRAERRPGQRVRPQHVEASEQSGQRQQQSIIRADDKAQQMRRNQSDKTDDPGNGYGRSGDQRRHRKHNLLRPFDAYAEMSGLPLTKRKQIERAPVENENDRSRQHIGKHHCAVGPAFHGQAAH